VVLDDLNWLRSYREYFQRTEELVVASWLLNLFLPNKALAQNETMRQELTRMTELHVSENIESLLNSLASADADDDVLRRLENLRRSVKYDLYPEVK
jgi:hypothetical protein